MATNKTTKKLYPNGQPDMSIQPVQEPPMASIQPVGKQTLGAGGKGPMASVQPVDPAKAPTTQNPQPKDDLPMAGIADTESGNGNGGTLRNDWKGGSPGSGEKEPQTWIDDPATGTNPSTGTDPNLSYLISLPGLSDGTKQALGNLINNGYQPSQAVTNALTELNNVISNQPAAFQSQYFDQLNNVMNQILGRESFSYDLASDPMYQQYKDQYMQSGRQAMQDTMGQAAAMTGGYGSSYATSAGSQAYQQHLNQLNQMAPELYQMALQQYQMTGDQMQQQFNMLNNMYQNEYGQYNDQYNRWQADRDFYNSRYSNERDFDYGGYRDKMGDWKDLASWERDQYNTDRDFANADRDYYYNYAMQMIKAGKMPSQDIIDRLGLSEDDIKKLRKYHKNKNNPGSGSSSGGKKSGSTSSSSNGGGNPAPAPVVTTPEDEFDYEEWRRKFLRRGSNIPETK